MFVILWIKRSAASTVFFILVEFNRMNDLLTSAVDRVMIAGNIYNVFRETYWSGLDFIQQYLWNLFID